MRLKIGHSVVALVVIITLIYSCSTIPDCRNEIEYNAIVVKFYTVTDSALTAIKFDSIKAVNTDSIFYLGDSISTYELILDPSMNQSTFMFYHGNSAESLAVNYARNISIISEECGPLLLFSELQIESYSFDSAELISSSLDQSNSENIEIYF